MPSTYTTNTGIEKIATGEQSGTWGNTTNTNLDLIDQSTNGIVEITVSSAATSGSPNSLPITNGALSNGRNVYIEFKDGGDLGGTVFYQLDPNDAEKVVHVRNNLTNQALILFQGTYNSSNDIEIPNGKDMVVKFDGAGSGATVEQVDKNLNPTTVEITGALTGTTATFTTADNSTQLKLVSTDTDASVGPKLDLHRNSANPAADDIIGMIRFIGEDSDSNEQEYAKIRAHIIDPTSGSEDTKLVIQTQTGGAGFERLMFSPTETNFNDDGGAIDFRVESDNSTHMIFVDASADAIGIRKNDPSFGLDVGVPMRVITSDNTSQLVLESTDADANKGPAIDFFRNSASPNDSDAMGRINFQGKDEGGNTTTYAKIESSISDSSEGTEDGQLTFTTLVGGSDAQRFGIFRTGTIINQDAANVDLRVESTANANMLFVDAGNDRIGIGTNAPDFILHVQGETAGSGSATTVFKLDQPASSLSAKNEIRSGVISGTNPYLAFAVRESGSPFATVERLRIDQDGDILIGDEQTSIHGGGVGASNTYLQVHGSSGNAGVVNLGRSTSTDNQSLGELRFYNSNNADDNNNDADGVLVAVIQARSETSDNNAGDDSGAHIIFSTKPEAGSLVETMRIDSSGKVGIGTTNDSVATQNTDQGVLISPSGRLFSTSDAHHDFNRQTDGQIIRFRSAATEEGNISVSGSTVSYNGFSGTHKTSGITDNVAIGTVCSTIDELDTYPTGTTKAGQTRADHAKIKVSDTEGDKRVYGVLQSYGEDGKPLVASVGIGSIRVTGACEGGDLLESNGDGTAKVQSDDIIRSKTIGKVTIGNSDIGVKLVSCVLYCG